MNGATKLQRGDALILGGSAVVAEGGPAPKAQPAGPGRPSHGGQGPRVKARGAPEHPRVLLHKAWVEFLAPHSFQWFSTLTFAKPTHPEAALKLWRRFTNELNRSLYGRRWHKKDHGGITWILAIERQQRGVIHFHALMGAADDLNTMARRLGWMDRWGELAGFARIEAIRGSHATIRYVTKYVVKDGEIFLSNNLGRCRQPGLL